jgi:hypothetical protein
MTWRLDEETLAFVRSIEVALRPVRWHVALGGSVLHKGESVKDLDLIVFPRKRGPDRPAEFKIGRLHWALTSVGMTQRRTREWMQRNWNRRGIFDEKWVEVWLCPHGRRIDLLVLS